MILLPLLLLLFWYFPIVNVPVRIATLVTAALVVGESIFLAWRFRLFRWLLVVCYILFAAFILLPSRPIQNRPDLRAAYCNELESYLGSPYFWGGEGRFGIDCSGLVRRGMEDALVSSGFHCLDSSLLRQGILLWWQDTNAKGIGEGYSGKTHLITTCRSLNELDYSLLLPGDLAVTASDTHVMAYLGKKTWIAADPSEMRVTKFSIPEKNLYFNSPARIVRWSMLE